MIQPSYLVRHSLCCKPQEIKSSSFVLLCIRWYFLLLSVTEWEKARIYILVERCNRVLSVVHRDVICGNNVYITLIQIPPWLAQYGYGEYRYTLIRSFYIKIPFAILKSHDNLNAPRTATTKRVIFQNHFNIISTSTVSALWQINCSLWNPSGHYAMWISQYNLTFPKVVAGKIFRYFCFGVNGEAVGSSREATVRRWCGARGPTGNLL
jgi:hypothetical protein